MTPTSQSLHKLNSVDFMTEFINLYRASPSLWKVKSTEYSNKCKKEEAYQKMAELTRTVYGDANVEFVKAKINSIRGCFRKELKKVLASKKSGASPKDTYVPKLWYYELLSFTYDQEVPKQSTSSIPEDCESTGSDDGVYDHDSAGSHCEEKPVIMRDFPELPSPQGPPPRRKRRGTIRGDAYQDAKKRLLAKAEHALDRDEFDSYFESVAAKMRRMNEAQCLFVEKIINEAVFLGMLNRLSEFSHVTNPTTRFPNCGQELHPGQDNCGQEIPTFRLTSLCVPSPSPSTGSGTSCINDD